MSSRREWLEHTALTAAFLGLPTSLHGRLMRPGSRFKAPYIELAVECARWISASEKATEHGIAWPADPLKPESVSTSLYTGMPGVVVFLAELHRATRDPRYLELARKGGAHLAAEMKRNEKIDAGLYTGIGGLAYTFMVLHSVSGDDQFKQAANQAVGLLLERARKADGGGVDWNGSHDIISGNAGIALLLLDAEQQGAVTLEAAKQAGDRLIAVGERASDGMMWYPDLTMRRNMPNFSHGTAGIAYALATLYQRTKEQRYLDAALAGAKYLESIAVKKDGATVIRHHDGDGENLFYLGWCHGPVGTARLFYRLHQVDGDQRWLDWVQALSRGVLAASIPEQRTPGFWNNISQCCGNVGVGEFFLDLSRVKLAELKSGKSEMIGRVVDDTLKRGTRDDKGIRWTQAEHRVQPENLVAQTGYMQGAAGVGMFFLRLDAFERGLKWKMPFPDSPYRV